MNLFTVQNSLSAVVIVLAISGWPGLRREQEPDNSPQTSQQDQNKQKKGQSGSKDNPPPAKDAKPADTTKSGDKPAPLFGGSLNVKSSRQTKDTATLGFNGVDDNGQVQKSFLSATAGGTDTSAVQKMASVLVNGAELDEFIQQGGLNTNAPTKKSSNSKGKQ